MSVDEINLAATAYNTAGSDSTKAMSETQDSIFTKIIKREIPADIVYEDDLAIAFKDVNPVAPVHILVVPKQPIAKLSDAESEDHRLMGHLLLTVKRVAEQAGLTNGYRVVINTGPEAGQTVFHLHLHILGGRLMNWPPG
ncbi:MAG: histidine triad nucleotide-binding protein [Oculatellaceae cyanobacterium bins.114]|nr:histidine triad nucleotide-binding protein [Oculatellaceae cyanobacterium bins.114]